MMAPTEATVVIMSLLLLLLAGIFGVEGQSNGKCCAFDFATCGDNEWCNASGENCLVCDGEWIDKRGRNTCTARWKGCNQIPDGSNENPCCGRSLCKRMNPFWKQCDTPKCCSWDHHTCGESEWCNESESNCAECGEGRYVDPIRNKNSCTARWKTCESTDDCCEDAECITRDNGSKECNYRSALSAQPDTSPTPPPRNPPTRAPTSPTNNAQCCSWNLQTCGNDNWCNEQSSNCVDWCGGKWISSVQSNQNNCVARWESCNNDSKCCGNANCVTYSDGWRGCDIVSAQTPITGIPVSNNNPPPIINLGNLIDPREASELVTIPDPPSPTSSNTRSNCPHNQSDLQDWHSVMGSNSFNGQAVSIPNNARVVVRRSIAGVMGVLTIPSTSELIIGENNAGITLDARGIRVRGKLTIGSETCRIEKPITITLHGRRPSDAVTNIRGETYKGIDVTGTLSLHGKRYFRTWTRLAKTANPGDTSIHLQHDVNWEANQEIVLVTTAMKDSREDHQNEELIVRSVDTSPRIGSIINLDPSRSIKFKHVAIKKAYQAEVGLLTRMIKIQGSANDSEPTDRDPGNCRGRWVYGDTRRPCKDTELTGFGAHVIIRGNGKGLVEGVELFRAGQTNVLGRYPMHWHLLGDCPECYFRDSSVHRSYYRCISVHATNKALVTENVAFDVTGFCYYFEDGVEEENTMSFNLGAHIHLLGPEPPRGPGQRIPVFKQSNILTLPADVTASAFYITNVRNNIIGNAASGGWSGFAFPNLPTPLGPNRNVNKRPSSALPLTIDGNSAHSTGWWWYHAPGFYFGGALYYNGDTLEYNAGRSFDHKRRTCLKDLCAEGDCDGWCSPENQAWMQITNSKTFLIPSVGLGSWSGRMEIIGFEAHDVGKSIEALESGFWIDNMLAQCRTGEPIVASKSGSVKHVGADGFFWYDTGQEHIITRATFRRCGSRSSEFAQYNQSPTRGCDSNDDAAGCTRSTVFGFLTHSDQFNPEVMQGTRQITFDNCGRRFWLRGHKDDFITTVSGRLQNWFDADGSATGLGEPAIMGSGLPDAGLWWNADRAAVLDQQGPLVFMKAQRKRGIGHIRMRFDDSQHEQAGEALCGNGSGVPCPPLGYIKHRGPMFANDKGLPITAQPDVAGPVGGFGWLLQLNGGSPRNLRLELIEVMPDTPLLLSIPYPSGTGFTITAHAAWCNANDRYSCQEPFKRVGSIEAVRQSKGNTYHFDGTLLTLRVVQTPINFVGNPTWFIPTYDDEGLNGRGKALARFERGGVLLPKHNYGPFLNIRANCSGGTYCNSRAGSFNNNVCPGGFDQVAYDACCQPSNPTNCVYAW